MTSKKVWRLYSPVLKALVLLLGAMGQYYSLRGSSFASGAHFLYYTNVSNILASLLAAVLLALDIRALRAGRALLLPRWLWEVRFALVAGILLTFVVFSLLLIPRMPLSYLSSPSNLLMHNLVPLLACFDFVLFSHGRENRLSLLSGLALPLSYFTFVMIFMFTGNGRSAPYFFLDFHANGWFTAGGGKLGVFWWFLILAAMILLLSKILLGLQKLVARYTLKA
jgi:hypothetical protein